MTTSDVLKRLYRFCGSDWTRANKLRWTFKLWYLVDVRTVLVTVMVQAAFICVGCYLGVREVQKDAFDYPRMQLIGQAVQTFGILLICCFGEHYFARRAMRNENHADLIAVGLLSVLLGGAMLAESLAPRHATAIHPPLWVGVGCALISGLLLFVSASMYRRLGWRQLMRFGSAPAKRVMYVRLKQHETLVTLDLLCMMALGLATVRTILFALDEDRSGAWQLYVSCAAWVLGGALDMYLKWLSVHEKKVRTLVCAILGCLPRGWVLDLSVLVFAGNPTDPIAGAPSRAPSPSPVVTSSNASSTLKRSTMATPCWTKTRPTRFRCARALRRPFTPYLDATAASRLRRSTMATRLVHLTSRAPSKWRRSSRRFSASFISLQLCNYMSLRELLAASLPLALNTLITLTIMATFTTVSAMPAQRV